jgi:hypothetical protein
MDEGRRGGEGTIYEVATVAKHLSADVDMVREPCNGARVHRGDGKAVCSRGRPEHRLHPLQGNKGDDSRNAEHKVRPHHRAWAETDAGEDAHKASNGKGKPVNKRDGGGATLGKVKASHSIRRKVVSIARLAAHVEEEEDGGEHD